MMTRVENLPSIFAFGDPHLPEIVQVRKNGYPHHYMRILEKQLHILHPEILLIAGDLTWANSLINAEEDLERLRSLDAQNIIFIDGNHDIWFDSLALDHQSCQRKAYELFSDDYFYYIGGRGKILTLSNGEKVGICGTRGMLVSPVNYSQDDYVQFVLQKESLARSITHLKELLAATETDYNICLFHYPPTHRVFKGQRDGAYELLTMIRNSGIIQKIVYGHIHQNNSIEKIKILNKIKFFYVSIE
ncbi:MAG: hypothetical protein GF364_18920, partial [Candidatus Lokiarchaeota archaeon]|nr:hypothetical protein [Candidatus Lokiarchaeota archaeon]